MQLRKYWRCLDFMKLCRIEKDEPELHLHPQFQKMYLDILLKESKKRNIQFVIATHSPIFVIEQTIRHVKRFYFDNNELTTKVISPTIDDNDKFLVQILHYTNSAKIFFVDKVILVEGESDKYFFEFYLDYFKSEPAKTEQAKQEGSEQQKSFEFEKINNFEIININGKNNYKKWKSFLEKWKIKVYFIGDWDNVEDFNILEQNELEKLKDTYQLELLKKIDDQIKEKSSDDGKALLKNLISYLETPNEEDLTNLKNLMAYLLKRHTPYRKIIAELNKEQKQKMDDEIEKKYADNVYILQNGELEDYLGIDKGLDKIIDFCNKLSTNETVIAPSHKEKLDHIINKIFNIIASEST